MVRHEETHEDMGPDMNPRIAAPSETLDEYQEAKERARRQEAALYGVRVPRGNPARITTTGGRFRIGERVHEVERVGGLCKVIKIRPGGDYLIREFAHPHRIFWTDELHLIRPVGMTHDPKATTRGDA